MAFHRFIDPTYFLFAGETFPVTPGGTGLIGGEVYDRLNVISGGSGGSGSANAAGQVLTGVNQYTYFIAFGEDATSLAFNRGLRALAENSDTVDDLLRTSTPKISLVTGVGTGVNYVDINADVFVGDAGVTSAELLFTLLDNTRSIYNGSTRVKAGSVELQSTPGANILGTGWGTNVRIFFNVPIPSGQTFWLYYGSRTSIARTVTAERQANWEYINFAFDRAAQAMTLQAYGFNEHYRHATTPPSPFALNTPGAGAVITRDGQALTVNPAFSSWVLGRQVDPYLALFKAGLGGALASTALLRNYSGDIGFLNLGTWRQTASNVGELSQEGRHLAGFASLNVRSYPNALVGSNPTYTRITAGQAATLNSAGVDADAVSVSGSWFRNGGSTALLLGHDLLLVAWPGGTSQAYVIQEILSDTSVRVTTLGGAAPTFTTNDSVTITWVQPLFNAGGGMSGNSGDVKWGPLNVVYPTRPALGDLPYDTLLPSIKYVGDSSTRVIEYIGYHDPTTGGMTQGLTTFADGKIIQWNRTFQGAMQHRAYVTGLTGPATAAVEVDVDGAGVTATKGKSLLELAVSPAGGAVVLNITALSIGPGFTFDLVLDVLNAGTVTLNWSSSFLFSGTDGTVPVGVVGTYLFRGVGSTVTGKFLMTRTDY